MKLYRIILFFLAYTAVLMFQPAKIMAQNSNIFGVHLAEVSDINKAKEIINTNGGDWGWVTMVIRTDQLDHNTWQDFFNNCRRQHLIPIIRLATIMQDGHWKRPDQSDIDNLANFLGSLNWPSREQHIIIFNEINHAAEWGGEIDIKSYADISIYAYHKFKSINPNFVILSGALDLAAPDKLPDYKSAPSVYKEIYQYKPEYFDSIDALSSHSYPNHGFIGTPRDQGQHSIHGFIWEQSFLKSLGIKTDYPIFITETGWPHREGESSKNGFYTTKTTARFLADAYTIWSQHPQIKAVTPFIFNYPYPPFDHFSWIQKNGQIYPEYKLLIDIPKNKNSPVQITSHQVIKIQIPYLIFPDQEYSGQLILKNTGQSIWGEVKSCFKPESSANIILSEICTGSQNIEPNGIEIIPFSFKINPQLSVDKTFIGWQDLSTSEITPFAKGTSIYHPQGNLKEFLLEILAKFFD